MNLSSLALFIAALTLASAQAQQLADIIAVRDEGVRLMMSHQFQQSMTKRAEALALAKRALAAHESRLGQNSPELIPFVQIVGQLTMATSVPTAITYYRRALSIAERAYGKEHAVVADCLDGLAGPLAMQGEAHQLTLKAYAMRRKLFGDDHPETAKSLVRLGAEAQLQKRNSDALDYHLKALAILEQHLTSEQTSAFVPVLEHLSWSLGAALGDSTTAKGYQQRIAALKSRISKVSASDDIAALRTASQNAHKESVASGIDADERLLRALVKKYGETSADLLQPLSQLAHDYFTTGQHSQAAIALERLLRLDLGKGDIDALPILAALSAASEFYEFICDYGKAVPLRQRMVELAPKFKQNPNTDALNLATIRISLGEDLNALGKRADASRQFDLALHAPWPKPTGGIESAMDLPPLANLCFQNGDRQQAAALYRELIGAYTKMHMLGMPDAAVYFHRLGVLAHEQGDLSVALAYFNNGIANLRNDFALRESYAAGISRDAAWVALEQGQQQAAIKFASRWDQEYHLKLKRLFAFASERQRLAFQQEYDPCSFWATLGKADQVAQAALRYKGSVLDSLIEERRFSHAEDTALTKARQALMQAEYGARARMGGSDDRAALQEKVETLQTKVARNATETTHRALEITVDEVRRRLADETALIEIVQYQHHLGSHRFEPRYGAVVLRHDQDSAWIPLGTAKRIDEAFSAYAKALESDDSDAALSSATRALTVLVWEPIAKQVATARTIVISPDGVFNLMSFAALTDAADHFLCEQFAFHYVSSGRDVLTDLTPSGPKQIALFANPQFAKATAKSKTLSTDSVSFSREIMAAIKLEPLPGTLAEASQIAGVAEALHWNCNQHLNGEATEPALVTLKSPRVLHIATHGFFLPAAAGEMNPMLRSGFALAGAQDTFDAWKAGRVPAVANDGVVMADELSELDLSHTWLVTMSACDTGLGEIRHGEGVFGLRRSLLCAGTQNLLMTLWPIGDEGTVRFMEDFYQRALPESKAAEAATSVQRELLTSSRNERGLKRAVQEFGGFVLISKGKQ